MRLIRSVTTYALLGVTPLLGTITNLTKNDTYPMYSPVFPCDYLTRNIRYYYIDGLDSFCQERLQFSISPFRQSANSATNLHKQKVEIGDIDGRWNIPALFFPEANGTNTTAIQSELITALNAVSPASTIPVGTDLMGTCSSIINPQFNDIHDQFGFFSVPIKYRKYGLRFQFDFLFTDPVGLRVQTGFANIKQVPTFIDLTCSATGISCPGSCKQPDVPCIQSVTTSCIVDDACIDSNTSYCKMVMIDKIMKQRQVIAKTLGYNINDFQSQGWEDTRISLFFRHVYNINRDRDDWHFFLCTPYVSIDVSAPTGTIPCPDNVFELSTGNNGHTGLGVTGGVTFDFTQTVELGFEFNVTKFFAKKFKNLPAPTYIRQAGLFPQRMNVTIDPGITWNAALSLNAYHFLSRLSAYFQYVFEGHDEDCYKINSATTLISNISCNRLRENSKWEAQVVNVGFTYDISPNLALGFLWQSPSNRRNVYKSTTIMLSIVGTF